MSLSLSLSLSLSPFFDFDVGIELAPILDGVTVLDGDDPLGDDDGIVFFLSPSLSLSLLLSLSSSFDFDVGTELAPILDGVTARLGIDDAPLGFHIAEVVGLDRKSVV